MNNDRLKEEHKKEKRRLKENLWKCQANNDWLKEELEKLLQEKDKLLRMAEMEIKRLKEEI